VTRKYEWRINPPKEDGDFFYTGLTPDGTSVLAIVQIFTNPNSNFREACLFIPPGWRGNVTQNATLHCAKLEMWKGKWSGPEHGLCCITV